MIITSPAFQDQAFIPVKYSAFGDRLSPPLSFENVPENARSLTLIMEDLDAPRGIFDHWLLYNIPAADKGIGAGAPPVQALAGKNTVGNTSYVPPQPPPGKTHRYVFTLYALDDVLPLKPGANKAAIEKAMLGHQLAKAGLTGLFKR